MSGGTVKILAIDDERDVTRSIRLTVAVQEPSWQVLEAAGGDEGLALFSREKPNIILLDMRMPGMSGLEVLQSLRRFSTVPVIVLTVTNNELDEVRALEAGADDYLVKPFGHLELVARIRAVLRRAAGAAFAHEAPYVNGELRIDYVSRVVTVGSRQAALTATEFSLLEILARNSGQIVPSETLLGRVWGVNFLDNRDYLKVYMRRLREKIEPDPGAPRYLLTVRSVGYRLAEQPSASRTPNAPDPAITPDTPNTPGAADSRGAPTDSDTR